MTLSEAERIARALTIDGFYRRHLGRPIDPNGVSYACSDLTRDEIEAILKWGELPPQLMIADGWDDGRWESRGAREKSFTARKESDPWQKTSADRRRTL